MMTDLLLAAEEVGTDLIALDKQWLLAVNGSDSLYLDRVAHVLTTALTWLPLYLSLFYVVLHNNENFRKVLYVLAGAGLCVLLAGTVDDMIVKPMVARWRPTHDPEIGMLVDVVDGYRGGNYGFFSAHASNTFSIALFFSLLMRHRLFVCFMVCWSLVNCWTRMYLGVHYPGDITVGLLWGAIVGYSVYRLYCRFTTPVRYDMKHLYVPIAILCLSVVYAMLRAAIMTWA